MSKGEAYICDECDKKLMSINEFPLNWIYLNIIQFKLMAYCTKKTGNLHFCSDKCFNKYFTKLFDAVRKNKI